MKFIIKTIAVIIITGLLSVYFMGCKPVEKIVYQKEIVEVKSDCKCDTVQKVSYDTTIFVIPCDTFGWSIYDKGENKTVDVKVKKGVVTGKIVNKVYPVITPTVNKDSTVYKEIVKEKECSKSHIQNWQVWVFFISLILNVLLIYYLFKK